MYEHLVVFKFKQELSQEKEQELLNKLKSLKKDIPGIITLTTGHNETEEKERAQGYSIGLRVTFESKSALQAYGPHPAHQKFVQQLDGIIEDVIVVDYPI
ncbi:stress responsive alpha-beta barrel [Gracilibacillus boraciitolerans JCM 21714]|uniref:Stress responsive alpha-beta barrel n=1 Tax=Gracilibacillus boraciitolerans JCM 21714 TaxID=1298598 RepID=W4VNK7_9BACI|nr:Dabb family protein [Gracilibacillus boraciitolerans]GAE94940.1 stress responsive alpha-beta barrel [Gracilibacillus boraciitolerans JCM 21714]